MVADALVWTAVHQHPPKLSRDSTTGLAFLLNIPGDFDEGLTLPGTFPAGGLSSRDLDDSVVTDASSRCTPRRRVCTVKVLYMANMNTGTGECRELVPRVCQRVRLWKSRNSTGLSRTKLHTLVALRGFA